MSKDIFQYPKLVDELINLLVDVANQTRNLDVEKLSEEEKAELRIQIFSLMDELEQFEDDLYNASDSE